MRKILFIIVFIFSLQNMFGQQNVQFVISKPYCLLNFLETLTGSGYYAPSLALSEYISQQKIDRIDSVLKIVDQFKKVNFNYYYLQDELSVRSPYRSTFDLITIAAANAKTIDDFRERIIGIMPMSDLEKFIETFKNIEPYYNQYIWNKEQKKLQVQVNRMKKFLGNQSKIFDELKIFYGTAWSNEVPFIIAVYPIPGKSGGTSALAHGNCLCMGVLTEEIDYSGRLGVAFHEFSHVLYKEQPLKLQQELERYFESSTSFYKNLAKNYFNEALATACGNGFAYKQLEGKLDENQWYADKYIDGLSKAIYDSVESYINAHKVIDLNFVNLTIKSYEKLFSDPYSKSDSTIYQFKYSQSNSCIDIPSASLQNNQELKLWSFKNGSNQQWLLERLGDDYMIISKYNRKAISITKDSTTNEFQIIQNELNGSENQLWTLNKQGSLYSIKAKLNGYYLKASTETGQLKLSDSNGEAIVWDIKTIK